MSEYTYKGWNTDGTMVSGQMAARSKHELDEALRSKGILLSEASPVRTSWQFGRSQLTRTVSQDEFLELCSELIVLLKAGLTISEALVLMQDTQDAPKQGSASVLTQVANSVLSGTAVSQAFSDCDGIDPVFVSMLKTGEQSGDLLAPLCAYKQFAARKLALKNKVRQAMTYPLFLMVTFAVILALMFVFVVPSFISLYADIDVELPWLTAQLLALVSQLPTIVTGLTVLLVAWYLLLKLVKNNDQLNYQFDRFQWQLPIVGSGIQMLNFWQLCQGVASMIRGGTSLIHAMEIASNNTANLYFVKQLKAATLRIESGESFHHALHQELSLPKRQLKMLEIGEASSQLADMLDSVADYFETKLDARVKKISVLIEPIVMLLIGLVVGLIIVALYLPVFGIVEIIG